MSGKRQTTMAKLQRERRVAEKRQLKREKKQAAAAARKAGEQPVEFSDGEPMEFSEEQSEEISATLDVD
jgi:hypothetical protein